MGQPAGPRCERRRCDRRDRADSEGDRRASRDLHSYRPLHRQRHVAAAPRQRADRAPSEPDADRYSRFDAGVPGARPGQAAAGGSARRRRHCDGHRYFDRWYQQPCSGRAVDGGQGFADGRRALSGRPRNHRPRRRAAEPVCRQSVLGSGSTPALGRAVSQSVDHAWRRRHLRGHLDAGHVRAGGTLYLRYDHPGPYLRVIRRASCSHRSQARPRGQLGDLRITDRGRAGGKRIGDFARDRPLEEHNHCELSRLSRGQKLSPGSVRGSPV